jgi:hypothetical protein
MQGSTSYQNSDSGVDDSGRRKGSKISGIEGNEILVGNSSKSEVEDAAGIGNGKSGKVDQKSIRKLLDTNKNYLRQHIVPNFKHLKGLFRGMEGVKLQPTEDLLKLANNYEEGGENTEFADFIKKNQATINPTHGHPKGSSLSSIFTDFKKMEEHLTKIEA